MGRSAQATALLCFLAGMLVSASVTIAQETAPSSPVLPEVYYPSGGNGLQVGSEEFLKNYASLAGLEGVYVLLDYVFASSEKNGITLRDDDLEEQVRLRLENAGLRMLTEEEMKTTPGMPEISVFPSYTGGAIGVKPNPISGNLNENKMCADQCCRNSVWVSFSQSASILRRPDTQFKLGTWGNGDDSNWCEHRGEWMYDAVLGVVDLFIEDYKKAESEAVPVSIATADEVPVNCAQTWSVHLQLFDTDSAVLKPSVTPILDKFAVQAQRCGSYRYEIETHADKRATEKYNKILTQARAAVIKDYLVNKNLHYGRIDTIALGESQPLSSGTTEADHAQNRRVVIRPILNEIVSSLSSR